LLTSATKDQCAGFLRLVSLFNELLQGLWIRSRVIDYDVGQTPGVNRHVAGLHQDRLGTLRQKEASPPAENVKLRGVAGGNRHPPRSAGLTSAEEATTQVDSSEDIG
jgi:hypothetical protein